ncbi:TLR adapter interacting with SLC15A4 on the lysosome [Syngnathoides biaculeatus]|uniref:TLR adapter interacting with SLC15A4 on the lysosome n=1 Tax=Syngnathoides biaculeatus TaxID=300417 RepID=UPI002ADE4363|nr:TLR adapter interacting with SLC15A4 on the lysosome [Syngnathoides biaculeatus]XP_061696531.1 TLR adapter interacting with SLC15A4 on the lysosome [Syngnathoides biaculeatus]
MLCEGKLLSMAYGEAEESSLPCRERRQSAVGSPSRAAGGVTRSEQGAGVAGGSPPEVSQLESLDLYRTQLGREDSLGIQIPSPRSGGDATFLVPSFCQSICQNYSDLHIGGDQVLPLSADNPEQVHADAQAEGPFLQSCDVPPPGEDSPPRRTAQSGLLLPLRGGSSQWRQGSGRDRSFLFQGREGPFTNSLLNDYLEKKLLDLFQQYVMENMARNSGPTCSLLGSEMVLTSLDQITSQLSRDRNLEVGVAKDMVLSCLLRVAGEVESSEISTPFLQISSDVSKEHTNQYKEQ